MTCAHQLVARGMGTDSSSPTGQMRPDSEALDELRGRGIEIEALPTDEAVHRCGELDLAARRPRCT